MINKESIYFVPMRPVNKILGMSYTCSGDDLVFTECKIVERRYKLSDNYKVELKAIDKNFGYETFYQNDFYNMLLDGDIVEKTNDSQHVEFIQIQEYLTPHCYVVIPVNFVTK